MITALDSSVFWAIIKKDPGYIPWVEVLLKAASEGPLIISPVAFAELSPTTADAASLTLFLEQLSISYDPISPAAAHSPLGWSNLQSIPPGRRATPASGS
jgi:hypothetical protein